MKTETISEVMSEILIPMIQEAQGHHSRIGQYSDADAVADYIEIHFRDEIVKEVKRRVNWESFLTVEISGDFLKPTMEPSKVKEQVQREVDFWLWYECFDGGTFSARGFIEWNMIPPEKEVDDPEEDLHRQYDEMRVKNMRGAA